MGLPIRVLHVVVNMNRGGAETLIMNLYRHMDRSKIQFDFLTCKPGVFDQEIQDLGGTIHRIPYITDGGHFKYIKALRDFFVTNTHYKIVHSHLDKMSGFVLREAQNAGIPIRIAHSHNTHSEGNFLARSYKWVAGQLITPSASHFFACSEEASKFIFKNKSSIILKNGIDFKQFKFQEEIREKTRIELNLNKNNLVVGHVGRFNRQKNHAHIVNCFEELNHLEPNAILILVGDGPLRPQIEKEIEVRGLKEKVKLLGIRENVYELLQGFDCLLFPSHHEGLPVTLIEAQGSGLPCFISDVITKEVDLNLGLIQYINLRQSPRIWAEKVLNTYQQKHDRSIFIVNNNFDIKQTGKWLQNFYIAEINKLLNNNNLVTQVI